MSSIAVDVRAPQGAGPHQNILWLRVGILLILVIALVLVLISYLNYSNYRKAYLELNRSRYMIVAKDVRQTVLAGLNVGLGPVENTRLLRSIKEQTRRESGIRFVGVVDEAGVIIGDGKSEEGAGARWRASLATTLPGASWQTSAADTIEIGIPFVNNFNVKAGAVVIAYDKTAIEDAASDMLGRLAGDVFATFILVSALTLGGVYYLTRRFSSVLSGVAATIDSALDEGAPMTVDGDFLGDGVAREINDFTALSHKLVSDLAVLERDVTDAQAARPQAPKVGA